MACYQPRNVWKLIHPNKDGKTPLQFNNPNSDKYKSILLPCQKCFGCQLEKTRQWSVRIMHEAKLHPCTSFITLTYKKSPWTLNKRDIQLFFKRMRKDLEAEGIRIKYFQSGEYGEKKSRPHHHAIIFGYDFPDKIYRGHRGEYPVYDSPRLAAWWGHGRVEIGSLTVKTAQYVASYLTQKRHDPRWYRGRLPEFSTMSRGGRSGHGLAYNFYQKFKSDIYPRDIVFTTPERRGKPPAYYDRLLKQEDESLYNKIKVKREFAMSRIPVSELSQERQIQKMHCKIQKVMLNSRRSYEDENNEVEDEL